MPESQRYSLSLDVLLPPGRLGRWNRPDCLFVAMRQLQVLSLVDVGLCDVLEAGAQVPWGTGITTVPTVYGTQWPDTLAPVTALRARQVLGALSKLPRHGELLRDRNDARGALLVPWVQRPGRLECVGDFPLGGVWVLPLGSMSRVCGDGEEVNRLIEFSSATNVPIAIASA